MRILVTGVTGAVGRYVARQLLAAGHQVSGISARPHEYLDRDVEFVCATLRGPVLRALAEEADVVIHLAPIEPRVPGSAGINGVVHVTHAAARAGARLLYLSQAAGPQQLYRQAEELVSTSWAPSLIVRMAPPAGRQLDWLVCRTVATLMAGNLAPQPVRLVHLDDLVRFLLLAVTSNHSGTVDLATPDTVSTVVARHTLGSVGVRPRIPRIPRWPQLTPEMDTTALERDWRFQFGWSAADAVADTARGLLGRRLSSLGATELPGHLPLPTESVRHGESFDGTPLGCAAPEGLEAEFDDRIDPRFPAFSAVGLAAALPGPLTPLTLDVQLAGLRIASRLLGRAIAVGEVATEEFGNRAIAVFGHRPYVGVSSNVVAAGQLPGWDEKTVIQEAFGGQSAVTQLFPLGRPPMSVGVLGSGAKAVVMARALAMLRHLKTYMRAYTHAATAEHLDARQLTSLSNARLEVRIALLRNRIHQGWGLTALCVIDNGIRSATVARTAMSAAVSGIGSVTASERIALETAPLAELLRGDPRLRTLARDGDLDGVRAWSPAAGAAFDDALARIPHRGPGEAELANSTFGDAPISLLIAAAEAASAPARPLRSDDSKLTEQIAASASDSRELAHDTTMRFTHELRIALRELGSRRVAADLIGSVDDVYYLTCNELLAMPVDARVRIKRRRAERERLQALRLPRVFDHGWTPVTDDAESAD